jgi:N-methylhydantoinase A
MMHLATDVGGTFTDLVLFDGESGRITTTKVLTTPADPSLGVMQAIANVCSRYGLRPAAVHRFIHGGTTVINAITERSGVRTALVTTAGFRDVLEIGRGNRPDLYNLHAISPPPFVPRHLRFEVRERVDAHGAVLTALQVSDVSAVVEACRREGVEAIAVVFLHSYRRPDHEAECAALLRSALPGVAVCASYEISRRWREYERSNTAVLNAYVMPMMQRYLDRLGASLLESGFAGPFHAMQSNGGTTTFARAANHPLTLVESGPAGGVGGAIQVGRAAGESNLLYLDIGGTTAKCCVIHGGSPELTAEYRLGRTRRDPGYPLQVPVVDIVEIGAGGGSLAWFDEHSQLKVGPRSAGADPGPACYARGGSHATVTDALVVLGVLRPTGFAGGTMTLDPKRAEEALAAVGDRIGTDARGAARAVVTLAEASMINALKLVSVQRGHDPRRMCLVVSGGGGPTHAARLGRELGVKSVLIPENPGVFSAWGMLAAAPRRDLEITVLQPLDAASLNQGARFFTEMCNDAHTYFNTTGRNGTGGQLRFRYSVDMRYSGQEHSVNVACDPASWDEKTLREAFNAAHEKSYTFRISHGVAELVTYRVRAELDITLPGLAVRTSGSTAKATPRDTRKVSYDTPAATDWPAYERAALAVGAYLKGPALVEDAASTSVLLSGQCLTVDPHGLLLIRTLYVKGRSAQQR